MSGVAVVGIVNWFANLPAHWLGAGIGCAQGAGSSGPTIGGLSPALTVVSGPDPQARKAKSWKLLGNTGSPKNRFSVKINSKFGALY